MVSQKYMLQVESKDYSCTATANKYNISKLTFSQYWPWNDLATFYNIKSFFQGKQLSALLKYVTSKYAECYIFYCSGQSGYKTVINLQCKYYLQLDLQKPEF